MQSCVVIGLTGSICSGKSTICSILKDNGAEVIEADKLGHETYLPDTSCYKDLVSHFGDGIVTASTRLIDRKALGDIVFADPMQMSKLEGIVWPAIGQLIACRIDALKEEGKKIIVVEAAVLYKAGWNVYTTEVWFINVSRSVACNRLIARNGLTLEQAESRLEKQVSPAEQMALSRVVIDNSDISFADLTDIVTRALHTLTENI